MAITKLAEEASMQAKSRKRRKRINEDDSFEKTKKNKDAAFRVDWGVWELLRPGREAAAKKALAEMGDPFEQPKRFSDRIKENSRKYQNVTIAEAFAMSRGEELMIDKKVGNEVPTELVLGQTILLKIVSITKDGVVFDSGSYKVAFNTRNNLGRYKKLLEFTPNNEILANVTEIGKKETFVDIFTPMLEAFINPITKAPWIQNMMDSDKLQPIRVRDLRLVKGGYVGKAVIPNVSEWVGEDYEIDAFVPGSQIVLNTTDDFEQFVGQEIEAFITAWTPKPGGSGMSLICSRKNLLKHHGNLNMIGLHKMWCDDGDEWKEFAERKLPGRITGVINSSKKCGAFVEIPSLNITGMIQLKPDELVEFPAGKWIDVKFVDFDEITQFNELTGQHQRLLPYEKVELQDGRQVLKRLNIKPKFVLA